MPGFALLKPLGRAPAQCPTRGAGRLGSPTRLAWVGQLEKTVLAAPHPVVIVAHSLGCIATTHMGCEAAARVCGALLVAPADPERRAVLSDFAPVPFAPPPCRSIVVASSNDPFCPIRLAGAYARAWGRSRRVATGLGAAAVAARRCGPWCGAFLRHRAGVCRSGTAGRRA